MSNLYKSIISKTTSNKEHLMLVIDGYTFQLKNYSFSKNVKFWRCNNRDCGVLLHTDTDDNFLRYSEKITEHNHLPNPTEIEIQSVKQIMQHRAQFDLILLKEIAE